MKKHLTCGGKKKCFWGILHEKSVDSKLQSRILKFPHTCFMIIFDIVYIFFLASTFSPLQYLSQVAAQQTCCRIFVLDLGLLSRLLGPSSQTGSFSRQQLCVSLTVSLTDESAQRREPLTDMRLVMAAAKLPSPPSPLSLRRCLSRSACVWWASLCSCHVTCAPFRAPLDWQLCFSPCYGEKQ